MKDKVIVFFTRIPTIGKTKTRLEPFLDKEMCVKLQEAFIKDIYSNIKDMDIDIVINYSQHGDLKVLKGIIGDSAIFLKQEGDNLGDKMYNSIDFALKNYKKCVLIGSDLPLIDKSDISLAFSILENKDIALAPTFDGGYYLIGMKKNHKEIFNMEYSTDSVFQETLEKIESIGKTYGEGNIQIDIDDKEDFLKLHRILKDDSDIKAKYTREIIDKIMEKCDRYA